MLFFTTHELDNNSFQFNAIPCQFNAVTFDHYDDDDNNNSNDSTKTAF